MNSVERGFRGFREINTVYYDPAKITVDEMERALKKAGTYVETVSSVREIFSSDTAIHAEKGGRP